MVVLCAPFHSLNPAYSLGTPKFHKRERVLVCYNTNTAMSVAAPARQASLFHLLRRKIALREAGDLAHEAIRPVLVVLGGAMRGVGGGAMVTALHDIGVAGAFEAVAGLSAGAATVAYFAAGAEAARRGTAIFYNVLPPDFIQFRRQPFMQLQKLESAFREGEYALPPVQQWSNIPVWVGAFARRAQQPVWINARASKDPVKDILASCAVPVLWPHGVRNRGEIFTDGELLFSRALPELLVSLRATDVVFITNAGARTAAAYSVWQAFRGAMARGVYRFLQFTLPLSPQDKELVLLFLRMQQVFTREVVERSALSVPRIYVLWAPAPGVRRTSQRPQRLYEHALCAYGAVYKALGLPAPQDPPLVPLSC